MPKNLKITRVLRVVDSRECEECGDRWVPVPGTGVQRKCDRCGRLHEVHAYVQLEDGSVAIVGTGCMRGESLEVQGRMKSAASAAKTIARLKAELVQGCSINDVRNPNIRRSGDPAKAGDAHGRV
jgi:hypothetical protein